MSWDSLLTPQETKLFSHLFQLVSKTQDGVVTGTEAVQFFASSGVPNEILSEIWETADRDKVGCLTPETFAIALKLIACAQHGKEAIDPILATPVPLPQFDGVVAPSPMITNSDIPITAAEREKYGSIFKVHQPVNGAMDAETARNVFLKSKLSMDILGQIWNLADVRQSGTLSQTEFTIAMHYIAKLMDGTLKTLPDKLPPAVFQSASGTEPPSPLMRQAASPSLNRRITLMTPPQRSKTIDSLGNLAFGGDTPEWDVTAQEKQQFNTYFDKIDSSRQGYIQGKEAVEFFKNSRLPESELAHIWDLSDIQQRGSLSRDEFAVAMHLIHKRLRAETLPQVLPKTLVPPSLRHNNVFASPAPAFVSPAPAFASPAPAFASPAPAFASPAPAFASPAPAFVSPAPAFASPAPAFSAPATNDLLGDFGDDQVSTETNQVNLLQNQMSSFASQTSNLKEQKVAAEGTLEQLIGQKKQLEAQMTQIKMAHETAIKELNEVQEQVRREEAEWDSIRGEYNAAQQGLVAIQNEAAQMEQTLENGRAETESLKRRIVEIQEETRKASVALEQLRAQSKQQNMMLDINKRQVTAAEQDRSLAERNLEDYKVAAGLSTDQHEEVEAEPSSVMSTPALGTLFGTPSSPFDQFTQENSNDTPEATNDFDAIFGTMSTPAVETNVFENMPTSPTKSSRGPPPPPPQSRHHRQASISSVSSGARKQRAPPPPPPPVEKVKEDEDDFEAAFLGNKLPEATIAAKDDDFADFDDAFSSFDINKQTPQDDWTSAFEPSNEPSNKPSNEPSNEPSKPVSEANANDDWDSVFGMTPQKAPATGFDDSFSSFADDFGKSKKSPEVAPASKTVGIVGDQIQDLIKMGFGEQEAKEALNRYDQDLEKASNFLLDQAK